MGNSNPITAQMKEQQRKWMFLYKGRSSQILTNVKTEPSGVTDSLIYESCKLWEFCSVEVEQGQFRRIQRKTS